MLSFVKEQVTRILYYQCINRKDAKSAKKIVMSFVKDPKTSRPKWPILILGY